MQTDHLIPVRRPDLIIINKKERTCRIVNFADSVEHGLKLKESEKKDKYLDLDRELKRPWNMKVTMIRIVIGALCTVTRRIGTRTTGLRNKRTSGDHSNYSIVEIDQNTVKGRGDLRRLVFSQTPVKDHQLTLT